MWYHHHVKGTATPHYMGGLYGFLIIDGTEETDATKTQGVVADATEVVLLMSEFTPTSVNDTRTPPFFPIAFDFNWISTTNGHDGANTVFNFTQDEVVLFRAGSATTEPTIELSIDNHTLIPIAYDGYQLPSSMVKEMDYIDIGGGQRVDFLVKFDKVGTYVIQRPRWYGTAFTGIEFCSAALGVEVDICLSYDVDKIIGTINVLPKEEEDGEMMMMDPEEGEMTMTSLLDSITTLDYDDHHKALAMQESVDTKSITFEQKFGFPLFQVPYEGSFVPPGTGFGLNGKFDTPFSSIGTVTVDTCETWTVHSIPPGAEHIFHVHNADFMVTHHDGVKLKTPYWRDSEIIYGHNITIHVCFDSVKPGDRLKVHCHGSNHIDIGVSSAVTVIAAEEPVVDPATTVPSTEVEETTSDETSTSEESAEDPATANTVTISLALSVISMAVGLAMSVF